jgi:uncharacterized protein (DUF1778 family)
MEEINMAVKTETLTVKVSPEEKELVRQLAAEKDWSVSKWLYNAIIKVLNQEAE